MFNLADIFVSLANRFPDRVAIQSAELTLTYAGLNQRARQLSNLLASKNVAAGDRIGIALSTNAETFVAMLALWHLGATALVADFRSRGPEREKLVETLKLRAYIQDRPAPGGGTYPFIQLNAGWEEGVPVAETNASCVNRIAAIGISSGTTGLPQPVALTHECLYLRYALARSSQQWRPGGRFVASAPLAFSATRKHVISRLLDGGTVIFPSLLASAGDLADAVISSKANALLTVPAFARGMIDLAPSTGLLFPDLEYMMCCGAPMTQQEKLHCLNRLCSGFVQNYGSTMAGMVTVLGSDEIAAHPTSVGRPMEHVLLEIVDGSINRLPIGSAGIIRLRTPGVAEELELDGLEKRSSDIVVDGWIYPGDIGFLDQDGFLTIVGRTSDLIIRGGVNVYPSEIETVLAAHPSIREAAVVGVADRVLGEEIVAFITVRTPVNVREIMMHCASRLHPDKQPRQILVVDEFPRNANGKLVKRELVEKLALSKS